jgi:hypothetical protein
MKIVGPSLCLWMKIRDSGVALAKQLQAKGPRVIPQYHRLREKKPHKHDAPGQLSHLSSMDKMMTFPDKQER